jgi:hypothetical protein
MAEKKKQRVYEVERVFHLNELSLNAALEVIGMMWLAGGSSNKGYSLADEVEKNCEAIHWADRF